MIPRSHLWAWCCFTPVCKKFFGHRSTQWGCVPMINGWGACKYLWHIYLSITQSLEMQNKERRSSDIWENQTVSKGVSSFLSVWAQLCEKLNELSRGTSNKIPCETVLKCSPNATSVCNSYRVSSPLLSRIPTLQPAVPESLSMMVQVQDKPPDFSQLLVHWLETRF